MHFDDIEDTSIRGKCLWTKWLVEWMNSCIHITEWDSSDGSCIVWDFKNEDKMIENNLQILMSRIIKLI